MPHEKIFSLDATPNDANCVQVAWGSPSSPSNTGPGHGNGEGHVMVIVERPGTTARMACSTEEVNRRVRAAVASILDVDIVLADPFRGEVEKVAGAVIDALGLENLSYAFGSPVELLAVMLDRQGCNKLIRATRKGRDVAFGRDE